MFPTVLLAISRERRMIPQPRTASIVLDPAAHPFGELGILDDVVDDDPRHEEDEQEVEDARPVLGRPRPELEEGEADDEGPQEIESHMGLLGNEPEEGGVEKIEAVDGAEDLQGEIVSTLQVFVFPPLRRSRPSSCRYLIILPKMPIQILPIVRLPRIGPTDRNPPDYARERYEERSVCQPVCIETSANQSVDDGFFRSCQILQTPLSRTTFPSKETVASRYIASIWFGASTLPPMAKLLPIPA